MSSPSYPNSILVVVDPTQDEPLALDRFLHSAKQFLPLAAGNAPAIDLLLATDPDTNDTSADNSKVYRNASWLFEKIINPLNQMGQEFSVDISWSTDWYGTIINAAEAKQSSLIMLPMVKKPSGAGLIFNESIWRLLRTAKCPVLVVQPGANSQRKVILAAVNFQSHKPKYLELNEQIIARSQWLAASYGAELHIVNAYKDSLNYPDRGELANKTEVNSANIHVQSGAPDEVIADVAKKVNADIVVLGAQARTNRWRGNTSERIITKVDCDILTVS